MSATWLNAGLDKAAQQLLNRTAVQNLTVRLYTNNHTPAPTDTAGSFTECTLSGYAAAALTSGSWSGSTAGGVATYTYPTITFTFSAYGGGTTIYGYYVTLADGTGLLAELFPTAYPVPAGGGSLTLDNTYQDS